jgi:antitoxin YefM
MVSASSRGEENAPTTYSNARAHLATLLDEVYNNRQVVVIKCRNQKNVTLIAEDELSSLLESIYLLRSSENAKRLFWALDWAETAERGGGQFRWITSGVRH